MVTYAERNASSFRDLAACAAVSGYRTEIRLLTEMENKKASDVKNKLLRQYKDIERTLLRLNPAKALQQAKALGDVKLNGVLRKTDEVIYNGSMEEIRQLNSRVQRRNQFISKLKSENKQLRTDLDDSIAKVGEAHLAKSTKSSSTFDKIVMDRNEELIRLRAENKRCADETDATITALQKDLEDHKEELTGAESDESFSKDDSKELAGLKTEMERRERGRNATVIALGQKIKRRDERLMQSKRCLGKAKATVAALEKNVKERDEELIGLKAETAESKRCLEKADTTVTALEKHAKERDEELIGLKTEIERREHERHSAQTNHVKAAKIAIEEIKGLKGAVQHLTTKGGEMNDRLETKQGQLDEALIKVSKLSKSNKRLLERCGQSKACVTRLNGDLEDKERELEERVGEVKALDDAVQFMMKSYNDQFDAIKRLEMAIA